MKVDFRLPEDFRVLLLGSMGFSTKLIGSKTNLSIGQVLYRLKRGSIKRKEYRDGQSVSAGIVLRDAEERVSERIRRNLLKKIA